MREDIDLALRTCKDDEEVDRTEQPDLSPVVTFMINRPAHRLGDRDQLDLEVPERIADHATNIAEMVIFMVKGKSIRHLKELPPTV